MSEIGNSNWSETASSNNAAAPNGWTSGSMLPSGVETTAREMMSALKKWWNRSNAVKTSGGSANVQTLTYDVAEAQYYTGQCFTFIAGFTNSGSATLNVNALGAKTIKQAGANLVGNEIQTGDVVTVAYDGTNMNLIASSRRGTIASASDVTTPTAWTPADNSGAGLTITNNGSYYYKIGKQVTLVMDITYPATANGNSALISGLPATPNISLANDAFVAALYSGGAMHGASIRTSSPDIHFLSAASGAVFTNANLTTLRLRTTLVYFTA